MSEALEEGAAARIGRSQGVVYVLPHTTESIPEFLEPALGKIDPDSGAVQVLVITPDAESALAIAEAAHARNGATGIEVLPATSPGRTTRLLRARPLRAVAGSPEALLALVTSSSLKLDELRVIVIAWIDDVFEQGTAATAALESLLSESGKNAERFIVTRKADARVEDFVERYARRPRRVSPAEDASPAAELPEIKYVTTAPVSKPAALRRLLDDLDPPSAVIVVRSALAELEAKRVLRTLGYLENDESVRVARGEAAGAAAAAHTIVLYEPPVRRDELAGLTGTGAVNFVTLVAPSELPPLRDLAGAKLSPFNFTSATAKLRRRDDAVRSELRSILTSGIPPREISPLEPLLEEFDAVEIAAAALQLLERERRVAKAQTAPSPAAAATAAKGPSGSMAKLFITVGEKDGIKRGDLLGTIAGDTGINGAEIGKIEMFDAHSIVEVPASEAERIISVVNGKTIRGRKVVVRADRPKSERADRPGSDRPRFDRPERPRSDGAGRPSRGGYDRPKSDRPRSDRPRPGGPRSDDRRPPRAGSDRARPGSRPGRPSSPPRGRPGR